jgi:hypothetical protein
MLSAMTDVGFVYGMHLTRANTSEVTQLEQAVGALRPRCVLADKGYASALSKKLVIKEDGLSLAAPL